MLYGKRKDRKKICAAFTIQLSDSLKKEGGKNAVISTLPDNGVPTGFPLDKSFITSQYYVLQTVANQ